MDNHEMEAAFQYKAPDEDDQFSAMLQMPTGKPTEVKRRVSTMRSLEEKFVD